MTLLRPDSLQQNSPYSQHALRPQLHLRPPQRIPGWEEGPLPPLQRVLLGDKEFILKIY